MNTFGTMARLRWICSILAAVCLTLCGVRADTITLKDGSVLQGTITREGDRFVFISVQVGGIAHEKFVMREQIAKIERDSVAEPSGDAKNGNGNASEAAKPADAQEGRATRVAILNFGPPSSWQGQAGNTVGLHISAENFKSVIPLLEQDKTDVVVVRINSGGGYLFEAEKFHEVFAEYQRKFRTVTWIESAISCAAMSPWVIREQYMMPQGNIGGCTAWSGALQAVEGVPLEELLYLMERASAVGEHDYRIMRAMQILNAPLSANVDPVTGLVSFTQDTSGDIVLNQPSTILTLTADQAEKIKFSRGTAATPDELMKAMGIQEYEIVGERASKKIDQYMREATRLEKQLGTIYEKYRTAIQAAQSLQGPENKTQRGAQIGIARRHLNDLRGLININSKFKELYGMTPEWFEEQDRLLREIAA